MKEAAGFLLASATEPGTNLAKLCKHLLGSGSTFSTGLAQCCLKGISQEGAMIHQSRLGAPLGKGPNLA